MKNIRFLLLFAVAFALLCMKAGASEIAISAPDESISVTENVFSAASDATEIVYELDGNILSQKGESIEVAPQLLYVGQHTLTVYGIYEDGSIALASKNFTVYKGLEKERFTTGFDDFDGIALPSGMTAALNSTSVGASVMEKGEGPMGEEDAALKITALGKFTSSAPYLQFLMSKPYPSAEVVIEYDIKFNTNTDCFWHEFKNTANENFFFLEWSKLFYSNGLVYGTDTAYNADSFMHIRIVQNFKTGKSDMYIGDSHVISDRAMTSAATDMQLARFCMTSPTSEGGAGYVIDNIKIYEKKQYTGISRAEQDGANLKVYMNEALLPASVTSDKVNLFVNGEKAPAAASYDAESKIITLVPDASLPQGADVQIQLLGSIALEEGYQTDSEAIANIKIPGDSFSASKPEFTVNDVKCISTRQLVAGKTIKAKSRVYATDEESVLIILVARENNVLKAIDAKTWPLYDGEQTVEASFTLPTSFDTISAVVCGSWENAAAVSQPAILKKVNQ